MHEVYIAMVIVGCLSVAGTAGNALVIYVFSHQKQKMTCTIFILSLAYADFMTSFVTMPFTITLELLEKLEYDPVCKIFHFLVNSTVPFSALNMAAIAVDRYICIVHPLKHVTIMTINRAKYVVGALLLMAITLGLLSCLIFGTSLRQVTCVMINSTDDSMANETSHHRTVADAVLCNASLEVVNFEIIQTGYCLRNDIILGRSFFVVVQQIHSSIFAVCLVVVIVLYVVIYRTVLKCKRQHPKTAVMLSIVSVIFIVAFLPAWLMSLKVLKFNIIIFYLYFTYNVANPIVYAFLNENFRSQLQVLVKCKRAS